MVFLESSRVWVFQDVYIQVFFLGGVLEMVGVKPKLLRDPSTWNPKQPTDGNMVISNHLERQVSYFLGNLTLKPATIAFKKRALGFPTIS